MSFVAEAILSAYTACNMMRVVSYIPQIVRIARDSDGARAISLSTWWLWIAANATTTLYAWINLGDAPLALLNAMNTACCLAAVALTACKRRAVSVGGAAKPRYEPARAEHGAELAAQARHPTGDAEATPLPRGSETVHGQPPPGISASSLLPHLAMLLAFQIGSGILVRDLRIPVPGPLVGMLALLAFLSVRKSASAGLRQLSKTVIDHMNLFFVPAGASIVTATALTGIDALAIAAAVAVSTLVSIAISAALDTLASKLRARPMAPEMPAVMASGLASKGNENERRIERCQRGRM